MLALFSSLLILFYFSILDYRNGEIVAWKVSIAILLQFATFSLSGSTPYIIVLAVLVYGLVFQWVGLWYGADTAALVLVFMQHVLNPFLLLSIVCLTLAVYMSVWNFRREDRPRLIPGFFLALVFTTLIQVMSTFPTSI